MFKILSLFCYYYWSLCTQIFKLEHKENTAFISSSLIKMMEDQDMCSLRYFAIPVALAFFHFLLHGLEASEDMEASSEVRNHISYTLNFFHSTFISPPFFVILPINLYISSIKRLLRLLYLLHFSSFCQSTKLYQEPDFYQVLEVSQVG